MYCDHNTSKTTFRKEVRGVERIEGRWQYQPVAP
jgi:hypothetical protein